MNPTCVDMSPEAIDERLLLVARLSAEAPAGTPAVDMSPDAVAARLEEACQLSQLCFELMEAGQQLRWSASVPGRLSHSSK